MRVCVFILASGAIVLTGCAKQSVSYTDISDGSAVTVADTDAGGGQQFNLPVSTLVVAPKQDGATPAPAKPVPDDAEKNSTPVAEQIKVGSETFSVSVAPQESANEFRINNNDGLFSSTDVQITRLPNTNIPSAVGVSFTDNTATIITQAGSILATVVPLIAAAAGPAPVSCATPTELKAFTLEMPDKSLGATALAGQPCWYYSVTYGPDVPPNTMTLATFRSITGSKNQARQVSFFPVPACRDATIVLTQGVSEEAAKVQTTIKQRVETPDYLYPMPLPQKGSIKLHPICNADVSDTPTNQTAAYLSAVSSLLTDVKTIETSGQSNPPPGAPPAQ
jgi:hypothetical protein